MKKLIASMTAAVMLCAGAAALADSENYPTFGSFSPIIMEDENVTVDEKAFMGEWTLKAAFLGHEYVEDQTLAEKYSFNFMPFVITEGKISQDAELGDGEFTTVETPYVFEAGQLQGEDLYGYGFAVELEEDGNIVLSLFVPNEAGGMDCLSLFLVHPAE